MTAPVSKQMIGFIGAGNMARSMAGGLIANDWPKNKILLSDPDEVQRQGAQQALGVEIVVKNAAVVDRADILVLAVKPQSLAEVVAEIAGPLAEKNPLIISIAAGILTGDLIKWIGREAPVVRVMPNTPALIGSGASGLYANEYTNEEQREQAETIMRATGVTVWVKDEALLDIITALSGSGPAYFLLVMEVMESAATKAGLDQKSARLLTLETALGAAKMALESSVDPATLRQRVTSAGGTTEAAIKILEQGKIDQLFTSAINAATTRSKELAEMFGKK